MSSKLERTSKIERSSTLENVCNSFIEANDYMKMVHTGKDLY